MRMAISGIALAACARGELVDGDAVPPAPGRAIDLVFVVHDAMSMAKAQADLVLDAPSFWERLDRAGLDYRIGVTTTGRDFAFDVTTPFGTSHGMQTGADGALLHPAACGMSRPWIDRDDPAPAVELMCAIAVGGAGPEFQMPLGALRDALDDRSGTNAGFHRPGALVAAVIVTDGDDCSYEQAASLPGGQSLCVDMVEPVASYVDFLDGFAGERAKWAAVVVAAPGPDACISSYGTADPATRLVELVTDAGASATLSSICDADLAGALDHAVALFDAAAR